MKKDSKHNQQVDFIKNLAKIAKDLDLAEIDFKEKDLNIKINRISSNTSFNVNPTPVSQHIQAPVVATSQPSKIEESKNDTDYTKHSGAILSPMVGVVYTAPNVDAKDFVSVGDNVKQGDTILLIEAMKVFNPIKASKDGKISKILIKSNQAVEFNQPLIIIE